MPVRLVGIDREMGPTLATDLTRSERGSGGDLEALYLRHAPSGLRLAYLLAGDRELAEDLLQEAFVRIASRSRSLRDPEAFGSYLRRTIVNLYKSYLRRRRLERVHLARLRLESAPPASPPEEDDVVWEALGRLPRRQRAALVLRFCEDLSQKETARLLGTTQGAAKQLVVRGLNALRAEIGSDEG